jgi:CRP/FNR family cyclic AMP-dependent transcriptional regulator
MMSTISRLASFSRRRGVAAGKIEALRRSPVFAHLRSRQLGGLATYLDQVQVPAGTVLVREGRRNQAFWLVLEGEAAVSVRGRRRRTIGPGGFFGAISMLDGREASATVVASSPLRALVASAAQFRGLEANELVTLRLRAESERRLREDQLALARELPRSA